LPDVVPAQLNVVTLGARDLPRLRDFYRGLGWRVAAEAEEFCGFELRGAVLALFPWERLAADGEAEPASPQKGMRGFTLAITVDRAEQVDEIIAEVERAGGRVSKPPTDPKEFEGRHAYFADPEENYWEVAYSASDGPMMQAIRRATG
jgi:catechol 2,3-dioxygenase-like lactoylglutathione lyase family enzyme